AKAMSKHYEKSNSPNEQSTDIDCKDCEDTKFLIEKVEEETLGGKVIKKDVGRPCHCAEQRHLKNRFKNALIPDEFKNARFDNYEQNSNVQQVLYRATKDYLRDFKDIITAKPDHNSLGFIAVFGESRM